MGCKSCKKNNKGLSDGLLGDSKERLIDSLWDDSVGSTSRVEQVILLLFAWIPLGVGYYTLIKFLIHLL